MLYLDNCVRSVASPSIKDKRIGMNRDLRFNKHFALANSRGGGRGGKEITALTAGLLDLSSAGSYGGSTGLFWKLKKCHYFQPVYTFTADYCLFFHLNITKY